MHKITRRILHITSARHRLRSMLKITFYTTQITLPPNCSTQHPGRVCPPLKNYSVLELPIHSIAQSRASDLGDRTSTKQEHIHSWSLAQSTAWLADKTRIFTGPKGPVHWYYVSLLSKLHHSTREATRWARLRRFYKPLEMTRSAQRCSVTSAFSGPHQIRPL